MGSLFYATTDSVILVPMNFIEAIWEMIQEVWNDQANLVSGIVLGMILSWMYHKFIGIYTIKRSYKEIIESKNETIESLKMVVSERLDKIQPDKYDKTLIGKIKKFFKHKVTSQR